MAAIAPSAIRMSPLGKLPTLASMLMMVAPSNQHLVGDCGQRRQMQLTVLFEHGGFLRRVMIAGSLVKASTQKKWHPAFSPCRKSRTMPGYSAVSITARRTKHGSRTSNAGISSGSRKPQFCSRGRDSGHACLVGHRHHQAAGKTFADAPAQSFDQKPQPDTGRRALLPPLPRHTRPDRTTPKRACKDRAGVRKDACAWICLAAWPMP